tara:strand:- start:264 stop:686 length:423 start_codon:yes stop_codon:yes gene_type:complete
MERSIQGRLVDKLNELKESMRTRHVSSVEIIMLAHQIVTIYDELKEKVGEEEIKIESKTFWNDIKLYTSDGELEEYAEDIESQAFAQGRITNKDSGACNVCLGDGVLLYNNIMRGIKKDDEAFMNPDVLEEPCPECNGAA